VLEQLVVVLHEVEQPWRGPLRTALTITTITKANIATTRIGTKRGLELLAEAPHPTKSAAVNPATPNECRQPQRGFRITQ